MVPTVDLDAPHAPASRAETNHPRPSASSGELDDRSVQASRAESGERGARGALRKQIRRLEGELSTLIAGAFPHVSPSEGSADTLSGPRLLSLGELERVRDRLVIDVSRARRQARQRAELEHRSRALLERMKREPAGYKFMRLPVSNLGGGCGVWVVRPRLGLIGMLAGWWQVKLSSGCP